MAAGLTQLKYLYEHQEIYKDLEVKGQKLYGGIEEILKETNSPYQINHVSSLGSIFFATEEVKDYASAKTSDTRAFSEYFLYMLKTESILHRHSLRQCSFLWHIRMPSWKKRWIK